MLQISLVLACNKNLFKYNPVTVLYLYWRMLISLTIPLRCKMENNSQFPKLNWKSDYPPGDMDFKDSIWTKSYTCRYCIQYLGDKKYINILYDSTKLENSSPMCTDERGFYVTVIFLNCLFRLYTCISKYNTINRERGTQIKIKEGQ